MSIRPSGPTTAKVMVVTDYPHTSDFAKGTILSSKEGWLFNKMLNEAGGSLTTCYVTSTCKHSLEFDKKKHKSKPQQLKHIADHTRTQQDLKDEIKFINPNVIISVGEWPLQTLTRNSNIRRFQGSILNLAPEYEKDNIKVIPVQHPREIWKTYNTYYYTPIYLKRALEFKDNPYPFKEVLHIEVATNFNMLYNYLKDNQHEPFIVSDIETFYGMISCIGISLTDDSALVIPILEELISIPELCEMFKLLQKAYTHFPYVNQNAVFDQIRLEQYGFRIPYVLGDTMLNASVIYPELPKNLGFLNSLYTNIPYFKDEGTGYRPSKQLYMYCGKDCISTRQIYKKQMVEAEEIKVKPFISNHLMKFYPVYRDMQLRGLQVDGKVKQELLEKYNILASVYISDIKDILGRDINPLSPKQCQVLLYDELKLPRQKKRRTNNEYTDTADEDAIDFLLLNHVDDPATRNLLQKIVYSRKVDKILNYINIPLHPGDVLRTSYNLAGTETGRTSSSKSGDYLYDFSESDGITASELGFALQTLPKHGFELADGSRLGEDIRRMFVPRDGFVYCEGDQSKAEAVIVTVLAEDWGFYHKFYTINIHKVTAIDVFGLKDISEITTDQYNKGKRVRHAANYDMKEATLAKQALCSLVHARNMLMAFHQKNWRIKGKFHRDINEFVQRNMWLNTPYGRRRDFLVNPKDNNYLREAYAYIPQSIVSDKTKIAMYEAKEILSKKKVEFYFLSESHDSALSEVRKGQEHEYMQVMKDRIEQPIDMRKCCIPRDIDAVIRFDSSISEENWKEMREYKC